MTRGGQAGFFLLGSGCVLAQAQASSIHDTPPVTIAGKNPPETRTAVAAGVGTGLMAKVEVEAEGRPRRVHILNPDGYGHDEAARQAIAEWRFRPATRSGQSVAASTIVELRFGLFAPGFGG